MLVIIIIYAVSKSPPTMLLITNKYAVSTITVIKYGSN